MARETLVKPCVLVAGCVLMIAGCGAAAAARAQHADKPTHQPAITVSSDLPTPIPGAGWSFAPYSSRANSPHLVSADAALAAARGTGINSAAWTNGTTPIATLVEFTNTYQGTPATPAWVIYVDNVPIALSGPASRPSTVPSQVVGHAGWIINAQTGAYIGAGNA
jgi:hypothetical protein